MVVRSDHALPFHMHTCTHERKRCKEKEKDDPITHSVNSTLEQVHGVQKKRLHGHATFGQHIGEKIKLLQTLQVLHCHSINFLHPLFNALEYKEQN